MIVLMRNGLPRPPLPARDKRGIWFDDRRGETHPSSKLDGNRARWIVRCRRNGISREELAALLGVSACSVRNVELGTRYAAETLELRRTAR